MSLTQERIDQFLLELAELTNKHKIAIEGCGCCGSPRLQEIEFPGSYSIGYSDVPTDDLTFTEGK